MVFVSPTDGIRVGPRWSLSLGRRSNTASGSGTRKRSVRTRPRSIVGRTRRVCRGLSEAKEWKDLDSINRRRKQRFELALILRQFYRRDDIQILQTVAKTCLIQEGWRQGRHETGTDHDRMPEIRVAHARWKSREHVIGNDAFVSEVDVRLVPGVEIVVDFHIVLFAVAGGFTGTEQIIETCEVTENAV